MLPPLPNDFKRKKYNPDLDTIDRLSIGLLKLANISVPKMFVPVDIIADGNCFPRALSKIIWGTECHHIEIRIRLIREGVLREDQYLNDAYLKVGAPAKIQDDITLK